MVTYASHSSLVVSRVGVDGFGISPDVGLTVEPRSCFALLIGL